MPKKGKKFFTAALAAVKIKKGKKKASKKHVSSSSESEYSYGSSEYSSSDYTDSDDESEGGSSYTSESDQEGKNTQPPPRKKEQPVTSKPSSVALDDDDSSDSSSSYGCGVYRRREDITPDSSLASSSYEEESSLGSDISYEVESDDYSSSQHSQKQASSRGGSHYSSEDDAPQIANNKNLKVFNNVEELNTNKPKKKSLFSKKLRRSFSGSFVEDDKESGTTTSKFRRSFSDLRASMGSMNEASISSKGSVGSESSSKKLRLSFRSRKKSKGTTAAQSNAKKDSTDTFDGGIESFSDEESIYSEKSHLSRSSKSSSKVSERSKVSATSSKHSRKSKSSDASKSSKASEIDKASDSKSLQNGVSSPSLFSEDEMSMIRSRAGNGEGAKRGRGAQAGVGGSKIKSGRQSKKVPDDDSDEESEDTFNTLLEKARNMKDLKTTGRTNNTSIGPDAMQKYKNSAELSHSYKTKTLRNANANLKTSFTDEKPTAEAIANGTSSSRFAAMMRDLQYSTDNVKPNSSVDSASPESDGESDGEDVAHVFQAPKIVSDDDVPVESKENGISERGNKAEDVRSRFRTRTESMKKLLKSKTNEEKIYDSSDSEVESDVEVDEEESDEDNVDDGIARYSGQPQDVESGAFDDESSGEFSMDDEDEYYEDQAMTILTPITEADNETFASTIKPRSTTDDDSVEKYNSMVSPKTPANIAERKDREESTGGSSDSASSHDSTSSGDYASSSMHRTNENVQTNGHHEQALMNGKDDQYQYGRLSNQIGSAKVRMPNVERLSITETIARVKSNDPNFTAFNLDESDLNDFNATRLIFSLKDNEHITHISLAQNSLGDGSAASLANVLRGNDTILYLCLRGNQIRDTGAEAIGEALRKNRTLAHLDLQDNYINSALLESVEKRFHLSPPITPDGENSAKTNSETNPSGDQTDSIYRSLLEIDKCVSISEKKDNRKLLETAISIAMDSGERSVHENSLLLALSLSLLKLDPDWAINATGVSKSLGKRKRLTPWNKEGYTYKELEPRSSTDSIDGDISGVSGVEERKRGVRLISNYRLWTNSFRKIDPRWQIRKVFDDLSLFKGVLNASNEEGSSEISSMFTVWRPTSTIAISKMMRGEGVGKGLDIKGKSAKTGILAGFIPFLQIHKEEHKKQIRTISKGDRTKIFFTDESWRDEVGEYLGNVAKEMTLTFTKAKFAMARSKYGCDSETRLEEGDYALKAMKAELDDPKVVKIDDYAPEAFGIEVSCRVLWKGLVERKDISRNPGSKLCTDRESQPAFQDMNFKALGSKKDGDPVPVLYQCTEEDPFDARTMVLAYEEGGKVVPVVSDFDCFLIGTQKFHYSEPIPPEQVDLLDWCVSQIEWILESHTQPESWTVRWLEVLKFAAENNYCPTLPKFGYGDPASCSMIEASVKRLATSSGAVRHGPECFNYFFPQELDDKFLIVFPGNQIWKYVSTNELQIILREKIKEGYTFPLNPKWLLCDPGWISLFTDLLRSKEPSVQHSIDQWFPPDSGLRERILDIGRRFPNGFESKDSSPSQSIVAEQDYERYLVLRRARRKMTSFVYCKALLRDVRERAESDANSNCLDTLKSLEFLGDKRHDLIKVKSSKLERKTLEAIRKLTFFA